MSELQFDPAILSPEDRDLAMDYVGCCLPCPNVILDPDGTGPYLYRWHVAYNNAAGNLFFHVQVKSDPERPLHDHPWENTSVILSGGYDEWYEPQPWLANGTILQPLHRRVRKGDVVHRKAQVAHRLVLPPGTRYTMTLFTTGPKVRDWGFWYPDGWHHNKRHVNDRGDAGSLISIGHHEETTNGM